LFDRVCRRTHRKRERKKEGEGERRGERARNISLLSISFGFVS